MLQFQNTITFGDLLNVVFLTSALIGIFLTIYQVRQGYEVQKATFFKELYLVLMTDPDISEGVHLVARKGFHFDTHSFYDSPQEKPINRLLSFIDLICELYNRKLLTKQEMHSFKFIIMMTYSNDGFQAYLAVLRKHFEDGTQADSTPFSSFIVYCEKELAIGNKIAPTSK